MWLDQASLSSMKTPRYLTQVVRVMVLSLIFTLKSVSWLFLRLANHGKNKNESNIILMQLEYVLPAHCWLQLHNTSDNLLASKTTTALKQERPNASVDTSNVPLVVYFTSDIDNSLAGL